MKEILKMENIHFSYEDKFEALKNVSVTFCKGERIAVLGNNGAGKSSFFLCCNGVLHPQKGRIFLKTHELSSSKADILSLRKTVGLVFQEPDSQIIAGTVENEISFGPMNLKLEREEVMRRVKASLVQMNLEGYQNHAPQYLSGGEKKRVTIADILAMSPEVILFDEPTASLDPENVEILEETLDSLNLSGITLVVSTHDVDFAYRFAKRAIVFNSGEVIADMDIDEVFASQKVLDKAGLKKPSLYAAAELLQMRFPETLPAHKPRHISEFNDFISLIRQ